jgi:hypothetical protein
MLRTPFVYAAGPVVMSLARSSKVTLSRAFGFRCGLAAAEGELGEGLVPAGLDGEDLNLVVGAGLDELGRNGDAWRSRGEIGAEDPQHGLFLNHENLLALDIDASRRGDGGPSHHDLVAPDS